MRHRVAGRKLNRTSSHRIATLRNLAQALIEHGQICTTLPKAKALRPFVERLITLARRARDGELPARRRLSQILCDRAIIPGDQRDEYNEMSDAARAKVLRARSGRRHRTGEARTGTPFTAESVIRRLIETVAAKYEDRPGGYTRVIKLSDTRIGDGCPLAVVQLVGEEEDPGSVKTPEPTARRRRIEARYEMAEKKSSPRARRAQAAAKAKTKTKKDKGGESGTAQAEPEAASERASEQTHQAEPAPGEPEGPEAGSPSDEGDAEAKPDA